MTKLMKISGTIFFTTMLCGVTAFANSGTGIDADPGASIKDEKAVVYCEQDLELKEYINDKDAVFNVYPKGTIFEMDGELLKDGKETGWGRAEVKIQDGGGTTSGYFDMSLVKPYGGKDGIKAELKDNMITVTYEVMGDESVSYTKPDASVLEEVTSEVKDAVYTAEFKIIPEENTQDAGIVFEVNDNNEKKKEFYVNLYADSAASYITVTIPPVSEEEVKAKLDRYEDKYLADGSTVKVAVLKDGRHIDMNGYELIGVADDACQAHDGTMVYDNPTSK